MTWLEAPKSRYQAFERVSSMSIYLFLSWCIISMNKTSIVVRHLQGIGELRPSGSLLHCLLLTPSQYFSSLFFWTVVNVVDNMSYYSMHKLKVMTPKLKFENLFIYKFNRTCMLLASWLAIVVTFIITMFVKIWVASFKVSCESFSSHVASPFERHRIRLYLLGDVGVYLILCEDVMRALLARSAL